MIHNPAVFVLQNAESADHGKLYCFAAVGRFPEDTDLVAQLLVIVFVDLKTVDGKFYLTERNYLIAPVDD